MQTMRFTYDGYKYLISLLREHGYAIENYHTYQNSPRCVILRHDIDTDPEYAVRLAELEHGLGVRSTYFVLLRTEFYNVAAASVQARLRRILELGHEIGLHFDETILGPDVAPEACIEPIIKECGLLSALLDTRVSSVSMHRPSHAMLDADIRIPGIVNSYGRTFFHDFKYLSDSRHNWREPVLDIIRSEKYDRLHILTHAFCYREQEFTLSEKIKEFVLSANRERYLHFKDNITDLQSLMKEDEV